MSQQPADSNVNMSHYSPVNEHEKLSQKPYSDSGSENDLFLENDRKFYTKQPFYRRNCAWILMHILLLTCNLILCISVWKWPKRDCPYGIHGPNLTYTPAQDAIAYTTTKWDHTNIFFRNGSVNPDRIHKEFGPPSKESDDAWANIIQYQNIRLKKEELGEYKDMPGLVELADGSGYYATLSAYHSLHCIKRLHHQMYFDEYYPDKTEDEIMLMKQHGEHCLNILEQTVRCNPDLSVLPMQWGATTRIPIGLDMGLHQCLNWELIDGWMKERSIDVFQPGVIIHPILGEAYVDGKGDDVGTAIDVLLAEKIKHDHQG